MVAPFGPTVPLADVLAVTADLWEAGIAAVVRA